jgi:mannose-6-phosphate isomerase
MEKKLYPLKFKNILKEVIWGGDKLSTELGKDLSGRTNIGESWEISGVKDNVSVVSNGFLAENNLEELVEIYMGDLVGDKVYDEFGTEFPLLIKFIDANDALSIQVHPNDEQAEQRHNTRGKTEMWYVVSNEEGAELITGFNKDTNKEEYVKLLESKKIKDILNSEKVNKGDVFFIPAGRVHAIGKGMLIAEIQETSDITYRIYDWDRVDANGQGRQLHTEEAVGVIEYNKPDSYKTEYKEETNKPVNLADCKYFTTNLLNIDTTVERDYVSLDSFVIHMCMEGEYSISYDETAEPISVKKGETILIPASLNSTILKPNGEAKVLEVYIK